MYYVLFGKEVIYLFSIVELIFVYSYIYMYSYFYILNRCNKEENIIVNIFEVY